MDHGVSPIGDPATAQWYLAAIVESSDDAIIAKDLDGIIQSCNPAAERLFGYSRAELIGQSVRILIPPDRQIEEDEILSRIRHGERIEHFETIRLAKHGRPIDISLTVSPVRDATGAIIGVSKTARDITERRRAEAALQAQREWFRVTLASIGDGIIASDPDGRITYMNSVAEQLTGWGLASALSRPLSEVFDIVNESSRRRVENPAGLVIRSGRVVGLANHTVLISRDGRERPISDSAAPICDDQGRILGVVLVFRDFSEQRRASADRERLLVSERVARAEAERANRLKDEFVAMVSHELRTPLNAILGWTDLMSRNQADPAVLRRGLDVVARNTRLQTQLISDLLDISRIVSGKLRLEIQSVDLASIIEAALDTLSPSARDKDITIQRDFDPSIGPMAADPARLQQVIWNVLSNAIKFTPVGGRVTVGTRRAGAQAEIIVTDTGVGISPAFLPFVFDRFRQADGSRTRRIGGLGLGLSIVKSLVELHDGKVWADSPGEGRGSTFTMTLPIVAPPDVQLDALERDGGDAMTRTVSLTGVKVLVVEDDPDAADFLHRLLTAHGAEVGIVRSAQAALEHFHRLRPEIILSDISLPDMDGYELMERLRQEVPGPIFAVALTALARAEDRTRALLAGFQAHLAKPIEPGELLATLKSFAEIIRDRRDA